MKRIAIIAALPPELGPLVRGWRHETRPGVELWRRQSGGSEWIAACAGVGAAAAARAWAEVEGGGAIDGAVSTGWAGSLRLELASGRSYRVGGVIAAGTGERFAAAAGAGGLWLVTAARVADQAEKRRLASAYGADLVDMEAATVARLAAERHIPFHCIKGVTDGPADRLPEFNRFVSAQGEFQLPRFVGFALLRPWHWPTLLRMGRNSRRAARALGVALLELLEQGYGPSAAAPGAEA